MHESCNCTLLFSVVTVSLFQGWLVLLRVFTKVSGRFGFGVWYMCTSEWVVCGVHTAEQVKWLLVNWSQSAPRFHVMWNAFVNNEVLSQLDVHSTETIKLQQLLYPLCLVTGSQSTHQRWSESKPLISVRMPPLLYPTFSFSVPAIINLMQIA